MRFRKQELDADALMKERGAVLDTWPTGRDVADLEEGIAYQNSIPDEKRFANALRHAEDARSTLTQPRAGVCLVNRHIALLQRLQNEGGADLLPTTIDSYTRQNRYAEAQDAIEASAKGEGSLLNGFPAVNYGHLVCQQVTEAVSRPIQVRHGTPDARLLAEISLAAGFTAFEGGGISYNIPYAKNVPLERSLSFWRYVDRLVGFYAEHGVVVNREPFGPLTGTLVPPCIVNAVGILEGLLAAEQGVKDITLGYGQCGNLYQDVAAVSSLRRLFQSYLERCEFEDVGVSVAFHQWMGGFPQEEDKAFAVIAWGAAGASFARATKVITKSPHEALGVPTPEANVAGVRSTRQMLNMLANQPDLQCPLVEEEARRIDIETTALIESALRLGEGSLADGVARAFEAGTLDIPFAPSRAARGNVLPVRDMNGAVRILEFGALPFDEEMKSFHRDLISKRAKAERRDVSFQMVTDDIYAVSKGRLVGTRR